MEQTRNNLTALESELQRLIDELNNCAPGSEEYNDILKNVNSLSDTINRIKTTNVQQKDAETRSKTVEQQERDSIRRSKTTKWQIVGTLTGIATVAIVDNFHVVRNAAMRLIRFKG